MEKVEVSVRTDCSGYVTSTVRGKRVSCSHSAMYAVERLAEKLFPGKPTTIVKMDCTAAGRLHSKWCIASGGE